ncbi:TetR/AcrR family transcriptional regulator [Pseudaestuariivita atlantica]|uniref:TetR/AcrR family transcriptional regulator n=1 Tax=Pseudaestuariivita atlantica TaxID=1317121 RepID=UPI00067E5026|nr:TetR/AcrR family transcriptional regulator [Pseudaestuariivita atlantica]
MGLRDEQKSTRRAAILDAAAGLYLEHGFDPVRAEQISDAAGVSTATVYNYFDGKGDILMTLLVREAEAVLDATRALAGDPPPSAMEAYHACFAAWFEPRDMLGNRDLWRQGIAHAFSETGTEAASRFREVDRELCACLVEMTVRLKERGALRGNVTPAPFATALFNTVNMLFFEYSRDADMTLDALRGAVEGTVTAIVSLAEPGRVARG